MTVANGTPTIATLMGLIALLMWLSRQAWAEALFRFVPTVVWAFFLAQGLSAAGVVSHEAPVLRETSGLIAPFAIFLLTAGTSIRAVRSLSGSVVVMLVAATVGTIVGICVAYALFAAYLDPEIWRALASMGAGWIGGTGNMAAIAVALETPPSLLGPVNIAETVSYLWLSLALFFSAHQAALNRRFFPNANPPAEDEGISIASGSASDAPPLDTVNLGLVLGVAAAAAAVGLWLGKVIATALPNSGLNAFSWTLLLLVTAAVPLSLSRFQTIASAVGAPISTYCFYLLMALQGAQSSFEAIFQVGLLLPLVSLALVVHILIVAIVARFARQDMAMVAVSSWAAIGGVVTAPIVATAYRASLAPIALVMALVNYTTANYAALMLAKMLERLSP